jgi:hypothetical protein
VFVLKEGGVSRHTDGTAAGGVVNSLAQSIGVERKASPVLFAETIVHEGCHGASYSSGQIIDDGTDRPYRQGISMRDRSGEGYYFKVAEEAIVSLFAQNFLQNVLRKEADYKVEIQRSEEIKDWLRSYIKSEMPKEKQAQLLMMIDEILLLPDNDHVFDMVNNQSKDDDYKFGYFTGQYETHLKQGDIFLERKRERDQFQAVRQEIVEASKGSLTDQLVFDEFTRAHFTGDYMPLARMVEGVLGKGSFRSIATKLGEMNSTSD